jgi:antitoxin HicB
MEAKMAPTDYLKRPYTRLIVPEEDGSFRAEILEFPGCLALGDTAARALETLEEVAESWLESALARGQSIPEPIESNEFSGKLVLRLPRQLHRRATFSAEHDGVSLNTYIVTALATYVGAAEARAVSLLTNVQVGINAAAFMFRQGGHTPVWHPAATNGFPVQPYVFEPIAAGFRRGR